MHVLVIYLNKTALKVNEQAAYFVFGVFIRSALAVAEAVRMRARSSAVPMDLVR